MKVIPINLINLDVYTSSDRLERDAVSKAIRVFVVNWRRRGAGSGSIGKRYSIRQRA